MTGDFPATMASRAMMCVYVHTYTSDIKLGRTKGREGEEGEYDTGKGTGGGRRGKEGWRIGHGEGEDGE